jgi:hypothetical protein
MAIELGAVFPQTRFGADPEATREFALSVEHLGYSHLLVYDHLLGASHEGRELAGLIPRMRRRARSSGEPSSTPAARPT